MSVFDAHPAIKKLLATIWLAIFCSGLVLWWQSGIPLTQIPYRLESWLEQFGLLHAALIYVVFYTIRPLILFPAALLTIASGLVFGPFLGVIFTIIGENASANFAFFLARWFGRYLVAARESESSLAARWDQRLRQNGLVTVLIMRLIYLPFDLVNFACGLTAMRQLDFAIGTFIGIIPALVSFVLFGGVASATNQHRILTLVLAILFFFLGLIVARLLKKNGKEGDATDLQPGGDA
ncbi:MAG: hypothetical protein C0623_13320 [Desulfuromonas sp.]|nr:MAG: hypothetical protein C0623_13320 [Desulfuromonas sp.]